MSQAAAQPATGPSFLKRVLLAQESGLVLVIALMMAVLTLTGGTKSKTDRFDLPVGAQIVETAAGISVSSDGTTREYPAAEGWSLRDVGGSQALFHSRQVNRFLEVDNLMQLATYASFIAIMAVAMTGVIVMGGIDLSVGSIYALTAVAGAMVLSKSDMGALSVPVCLAVCCGLGAAAGAVNGIMVVGLRVHPFIITLGTMVVYRGIVFVSTKGQSVGEFPAELTRGFFKADLGGVQPVPALVMVAVAIVGFAMLTRTVLGRRTYAIGGNETAAVYAGVPVGRVKITIYTIMGAMAGLSAAVYLGYFGAAAPNAGEGYELRVIAAAVIGGASLSGGRGSALGAVLGALVIELINNAMIILDIDQSYNQIVMGAAIVAAVVLDQAKGRMGSPKR